MERKKHFAVDKLSDQARRLIDDGLSANATYDSIVKAVRAIGETLALSSLQRYHANKWFPTRRTLEETNRFYGLIKESLEKSQGKKLDEVSSELLKHHLFKAMAAIKDGDPVKLYELVISEGRLGVEREKLSVSKDKLGLERQKVEALQRQVEIKQQQLEQAKEKADGAAKSIEKIGKRKGLDAETLKKIREEVYGIVEAAV